MPVMKIISDNESGNNNKHCSVECNSWSRGGSVAATGTRIPDAALRVMSHIEQTGEKRKVHV